MRLPYFSRAYDPYAILRAQLIGREMSSVADSASFATVYQTSHGAVSETTSAAWATIRASVTGDSATDRDDQTADLQLDASPTTDEWDVLRRIAFQFDFSGILRTESRIVSCAVNLWVRAMQSDDFSQSLVLCAGPTFGTVSTLNLHPTQFDEWGSVDWSDSRVTLASLTDDQYVRLEMNDTGLAGISGTGPTSIGVRLSADIDDDEPTWVANNSSDVSFGNWAYKTAAFAEIRYHY